MVAKHPRGVAPAAPALAASDANLLGFGGVDAEEPDALSRLPEGVTVADGGRACNPGVGGAGKDEGEQHQSGYQ